MVGIVGVAHKGPLVVTTITGVDELLKVYGQPDPDFYGLHGAIAVLEAGGVVLFQRVVHAGTPAEAGTVDDLLQITAKVTGDEGNNLVVKINTDDCNENEFNVFVLYEGLLVEEFLEVSKLANQDNSADVIINGASSYIAVVMNDKDIPADEKVIQLDGGLDAVREAVAGNEEEDPFVFSSLTFDTTLNGAIVTITAKDELGMRSYVLTKGSEELERIDSLVDNPKDDRFIATYINKFSEYIHCEYIDANKDGFTAKAYRKVLNGGLDGVKDVDMYDVVGMGNKGMIAFSDNEAYAIRSLCAPGFTDYYVIKSGMDICEARGDSIFVFDGELNMTPAQIVNWSNGIGQSHDAFNSSFGALYYPWLRVYDKFTKQEVYHPSAGYICAQFIISDTVGDVYFAPAGLTRGVMRMPVGVKRVVTKTERDLLYGNRNIVNPIANFPNYGIVIWGQKTCQRMPSVFDRLSNRRLFNYLTTTIKDATLNLVFESNTKLTWDRWIARVEPILERIKSDNGLDDYRLEMGETTITKSDMENHVMPGRILIRCVNAAEFIPLDFYAYNSSHVFDDEK
jgi:hypothetical protein